MYAYVYACGDCYIQKAVITNDNTECRETWHSMNGIRKSVLLSSVLRQDVFCSTVNSLQDGHHGIGTNCPFYEVSGL